MKTLVIGHLTGKDITPHIPAEAAAVQDLKEQGVIRDTFLKADRTGPIIIVNDADAQQAAQHLNALPFVELDLVRFDYVELNDL